MTTNCPDLTAKLDTPEHNRLMRFTCGVQTAQHQANRALDLAQGGQWLPALEFLKAATLARNWINHIIRYVTEDNWSEVEFYLSAGRYDYEKMKGLLPADRTKPQGD